MVSDRLFYPRGMFEQASGPLPNYTWGQLLGPASEPPLTLAEIEDGRLLQQFHSKDPAERATALRRAEAWGNAQ